MMMMMMIDGYVGKDFEKRKDERENNSTQFLPDLSWKVTTAD